MMNDTIIPQSSLNSSSISSIILKKEMSLHDTSTTDLPTSCTSTTSKRKSCSSTTSRKTDPFNSVAAIKSRRQRQSQLQWQRPRQQPCCAIPSFSLILLIVTIVVCNIVGADTGTVNLGGVEINVGFGFGFGFGLGVYAETSSSSSLAAAAAAAATTKPAEILHSRRRRNALSPERRCAFIKPTSPSYNKFGLNNHQQTRELNHLLLLSSSSSSSSSSPSLSMISSSSLSSSSLYMNGNQQQRWGRLISPQISPRISTDAASFSRIRTTATSYSSSTTALQMVASTKSGGTPILTVEQFQRDVLLQSPSAIDDYYDVDQVEGGDQQLLEQGQEESITSIKRSDNDTDNNNSNNNHPILVLYSAPWCGPCRLTNPIIQQIVQEWSSTDSNNKSNKPTLRIYEVCTDDLPTIAESAGVVSIPTIQLYYDGVCYETIVGCVTKNVLSSAVDKLLDDLGLLDDDDDDDDENDDDA